jgi:hypothetical protein
MAQSYHGRTLIFDGEAHHYGDSFTNCRLVLIPAGSPLFLNCVFIDCEFDPPLPPDGRGGWLDLMHGALIEHTKGDQNHD